MRQKILLFLLLLTSWGARAQTPLQSQSFENGETINYTASTVDVSTNNPPTINFVRASVPFANFTNQSAPTSVRNANGAAGGTYFWATENVRRKGNGSSAVVRGNPPANLTLNSISVAGQTNLNVTVALADPNADSYTADLWDRDDVIRIQYAFDGNPSWTTIGQFVGGTTINATTYTGLRRDANYDGTADPGAAFLTSTLTDYTFPITGSGNTMQVRVQVDDDGGTEEFAFDAIRVFGTSATGAAPVLAGIEGTALAYTEGSGLANVTSTLTVSDADNANLSGATVRFTNNGLFIASEDELVFTAQSTITGNFDSTTGVLTLSGTASVADYQAALRSVRYRDKEPNNARAGNRVVGFAVTDPTNLTSGTVTRTITVTTALDAAYVGPLPYVEPFETDGEGTRYTSNSFNTGNSSQFQRTNQNPIPTGTTFNSFLGSYYWVAVGTSANASLNPTGMLNGTVTTKQINTAGYTNLHFQILVGASTGISTGSASDWKTADYFQLRYRPAGSSTWTAFGLFRGTNPAAPGTASGGGGLLRQDSNPNGTSVPTGTQLTTTLQNFDFTLPAALDGQTLDFQLLAVVQNGVNYLAFDHVQVTGTPKTTVTSIVRASTNPTNAATVNYTVTFGAPVTGLTAANFSLTPSGISTASVGTPVSTGTGSTWTVPVNTGTGSGTLTLNLINDTGLSPGISTTLPFVGETYTIDKTAPTVSTVGVPTNGTYRTGQVLSFTVNFSEAVTVTGTPQLGLTLDTGGSVQANYASGNGTALVFNYTIVAGNADANGIAVGTLGLNGGTIRDATNNAATLTLNGVPVTTGILVDGVAPVVSSSNRQAPAANPTNATTLTFRVTFSESVTGVDAADFALTNTGTAAGTIASATAVSGSSNAQFDVAVNSVSGNGTVRLDVKSSGTSIIDGAGNALSGGFTTGQAYTLDQTAPTVTLTNSNSVAAGSTTQTTPLSFTATFNEAVTGFDAADIGVTNGSVSAFATVSATVYTFSVTPTSNGTVAVNIAAGAATDAVGNGNTAASFSFVYQRPVVATAQGVTVNLNANGTATLNASSVNNGSTGSGTLTYTIQKVVYRQVAEGQVLPLSTPTGENFSAIRFASYGNSSGSNGNYALGTCNASNSTTVVGGVLIGKSSGSITADNGTFGDPCGGTPKNLAVVAAYSANATSLPYSCANVAGPNYVLLTVTDGSGNSNTMTAQVTVLAPPTASFTLNPTAGNIGATIAATGSNLSGATALTVNGTAATISSLTTTGFTFVVPTGATIGAGSVVLTTPCGQTPSTAFTVTQPVTAAPVVSAPANGSRTNSATPAYTGTAPAGSIVTVYVDGTSIGTTTATGGTFSLTQPTTLAQGSHTVYATAQTNGSSVSANSNTNTFTVDSVRPSVAISSTAPSPTSTSPIPFTVTFSEGVTGFVSGNVTVTNGTISGFTGVSGAPAYSFSVTPNGAGTVTVDVPTNVAQDLTGNFNTAATPFSITYTNPTIALAPATLTAGTVGVAYSQAITASGGTAPYTYAVTTGTLPSGLTLTTGGVLAGTPTTGGSFSFTITATDASVAPGAFSGSLAYTVAISVPTIAVSPAALPNGTQGTAYSQTITASGGTAPYTFAVTNGALPSGLSLSSAGVLSGTPTIGGSFSFTVTATDAFGSTGARSYSLSITTTAVTWTGAVSTDWYTAGNWTPNQVPTATVSVIIPNAPSGGRFPAITGGTAQVRNLTLSSSVTLTQSDGILEVTGDLTNNGTFQPTGGTVALGSSALSNILGSSNTRFWNLTVGASGAQLGTVASTSVQRVLTLNGNFATNGNPLALESNAAGTAMIVNTGTNVVSGNVTVQCYIVPDLNPNLGYRHFSAPIGTATVGSLATAGFTPVVNPAYNSSATPNLTVAFPTVYGYDQARLATTTNNLPAFDKGWFSPSSLNAPLTVGMGYTVNLRANQTLSLTGSQNNGDVPLSFSRNSGTTAADAGWQLIGNPYPSPLDWSLVDDTERPGLDRAMYVFASNDPTNPYVGKYESYNNGVGNASPVLPLGQGFFVRVSTGQTAATLTLKNRHRPTGYSNTTYHRNAAETRPLVQLTLRGTAAGTASDEAFVYFEAGATAGMDPLYDAVKLPNSTGLNLASFAGGQQLAINGLPIVSATTVTVPLFIGLPATGTYTLTAAQVLNFTAGAQPFLRDLQLGTLTDLSVNPTYTFTQNAFNTAPRFELVFGPQAVLSTASAALAAQVSVFPNPATKAVFVELPAALRRTATTAALVDALGRTVRTQALPAGLSTHTLPLTDVATGVYSLRLETPSGVVVKKLVVE